MLLVLAAKISQRKGGRRWLSFEVTLMALFPVLRGEFRVSLGDLLGTRAAVKAAIQQLGKLKELCRRHSGKIPAYVVGGRLTDWA